MQEKIIFGGTFNPIHHGHLICARAAAEALGAKSLVLMPAGCPGHKLGNEGIASPADRLEMCRLAIAGRVGFEIDDRETRRQGPTFTLDTALQLKNQGWKTVNWIIGADMLNFLPKWHQPERLLQEVHFIIMARPGWNFEWSSLPAAYHKLKSNVVHVPQIDISATDIRQRVKAGLPIDYLCPPEVCGYIREHGLYR